MTSSRRYDLVLVGGGAAGLAVLHRLASHWSPPQRPAPTLWVAVVDPRDRLREPVADRTWCSWMLRDDPDWAWALGHGDAGVAAAHWRRVRLRRHDGATVDTDLDPYVYAMVRSEDYATHVAEQVRRARERGTLVVNHVPGFVDEVTQDAEGVIVRGGGVSVSGAWALDSRPPPLPLSGAKTTLLQHFFGEVRRYDDPRFADLVRSGTAVLMDFRVRQPGGGVAFGYVLASDAHTALIEYTEFTAAVLEAEQYRERQDAYLALAGLEGAAEVIHCEHGVIPMTDAPLSPGNGPRVFRIGTAGGATRPSTGYTFATVQRQAREVVDALAAGRAPRPGGAHTRRHAFLDAVMLRALADGSLDGARFFPDLFAANPGARVLRFLDGSASAAEDARVVASSPAGPMLAGLASRLIRAQTT